MINKQIPIGGFSIIEMMIVLIVLSTILTAIFATLPQLQRNNRNNLRQDDVNKVANSITSYVNNNKGRNITTPADVTAVKSRAQPFKQFDATTMTFDVTNLPNSSSTLSAVTNLNTIRIVTAAECEADNSAKFHTKSNKRATVLLYAVEGASGPVSKCLPV